ncbi:MAG: cytochrome C [Bacteroidetes bacterium]|nr:MAG: cytochrome C [Bacteroidota bacterium]
MLKFRRRSHFFLSCLLVASLISVTNLAAQDGKTLFNNNCASCHKMDQNLTGPALMGVHDRWGDDKMLHMWVKNWPQAVATGNAYAVKMKDWAPSAMTVFSALSDAEVDAILKYIKEWVPAVAKPPVVGDPATAPNKDNSLLFGIVTLVMAVVALLLLGVNSSLRKLADDKDGIRSLEPLPFWKQKKYLALASVLFFVLSGVYLSKGAVESGRSKNYQPVQPIYYSHKVHAGVNQINCLYCHGGAQESKHSNIPSVNVCMNCHLAINEYKGEPLYAEDGTEIDGTNEIKKLYEYAGFTPGTVWDPSKAKPIEWVRIHNLPDHVYFNHAQHVKAGKVNCQTCHGEIQNMGEVYQYSDLSMGWCINCHRETKVQFYDSTKGEGNKFYSIYEKFHNDLKSGKMDSVTVESIGGTECQKCHY